MTTLADKSLLSGGDNKPPMLEKHLGYKLLMLLEQQENTLPGQVEQHREKQRTVIYTTAKGRVIFPSSVLCPREKGMKRGHDKVCCSSSSNPNALMRNHSRNGSDALTEKEIKQLDNINFKRGQSAQTVHMMTKSKICYDHSTKQAIGFEKPFYLKKVRESKPKLYDGNVILRMVDELADVQNVFYQIEQAVEQHRLESRTFKVKMNQVLSENERLLAQAIDKDIVKTVVNLSVNASGETVNECQKCLERKDCSFSSHIRAAP
ncbi:hypothetical protein Tco_0329332 [Tanacetum coccineum]